MFVGLSENPSAIDWNKQNIFLHIQTLGFFVEILYLKYKFIFSHKYLHTFLW